MTKTTHVQFWQDTPHPNPVKEDNALSSGKKKYYEIGDYATTKEFEDTFTEEQRKELLTAGAVVWYDKPAKDAIIKKQSDEDIQFPTATELKEQLIEEDESVRNFKLQKDVLECLASKHRNAATELLTKRIENRKKIYTTRHDEKAEMWIYHEGIYIPQAKTIIKAFCRTILGEAHTTQITTEVITKIEADTYIDADELFKNNNSEEIAVQNGILNIKTRELKPFTPKKIYFNKIPVKYLITKKCPSIIKHLNEVLQYEEDVSVMQELFGYVLLKEYKIEKGIMLYGGGRNGKSKTLELFKMFVGIDNCANIPIQQLENDQWAVGELFGKMINISADISSSSLKHASVYKTLTGGDMVSAPRKFLNRINFTNYAKMVFCANELPKVYDNSLGFWNRWILLDFPYTFLSKEEIEGLEEEEKTQVKLKDTEIIKKITTPNELSGLLNWALEGLDRLLKNKDFSFSKNTEEVKKVWQRKSSSFQSFIMDCVEENYDSKVTKVELRKAYAAYCHTHKVRPEGDKLLKARLSEIGVGEERFMVDGILSSCWVGIQLSGLSGLLGYSYPYREIKFGNRGVFASSSTTLTDFEDNNTLVCENVCLICGLAANPELKGFCVGCAKQAILGVLDEDSDIVALVERFGNGVVKMLEMLKVSGDVFEVRSNVWRVVK